MRTEAFTWGAFIQNMTVALIVVSVFLLAAEGILNGETTANI